MKPIAVPYSSEHPGWSANDAQFKRLFGLRPEQKWPDGGLPTIVVPSGVQLFVMAKEPGYARQGVPRLKAVCPCGRVVGGGRIQQHFAACKAR